jgi:cytochrome bd-type quinol oxidase subunit 1
VVSADVSGVDPRFESPSEESKTRPSFVDGKARFNVFRTVGTVVWLVFGAGGYLGVRALLDHKRLPPVAIALVLIGAVGFQATKWWARRTGRVHSTVEDNLVLNAALSDKPIERPALVVCAVVFVVALALAVRAAIANG